MDGSWGSSNLVFPEKRKEGSATTGSNAAIGNSGGTIIGLLNKLLWPKSDSRAFSRLIKENPEEMHSRHGDMLETLLHR